MHILIAQSVDIINAQLMHIIIVQLVDRIGAQLVRVINVELVQSIAIQLVHIVSAQSLHIIGSLLVAKLMHNMQSMHNSSAHNEQIERGRYAECSAAVPREGDTVLQGSGVPRGDAKDGGL